MPPLPPLPDSDTDRRNRPSITIGVVMALLLAALIALPFVVPPRQHAVQREAVAAPGEAAPSATAR